MLHCETLTEALDENQKGEVCAKVWWMGGGGGEGLSVSTESEKQRQTGTHAHWRRHGPQVEDTALAWKRSMKHQKDRDARALVRGR